MSATATVWATIGRHETRLRFRLPLGALLEIKERTNLNPVQLISALTADEEEDFDAVDVVSHAKDCELIASILEVGLVWGGQTRAEADRLVELYCRAPNRGMGTSAELETALKLLQAALLPDADEPFPASKSVAGAPEVSPDFFPFAVYYDLAGRLGLAPRELMDLSLWELAHFQKGWREANGVGDGAEVSQEDFDRISDALDNFEPIEETNDGD